MKLNRTYLESQVLEMMIAAFKLGTTAGTEHFDKLTATIDHPVTDDGDERVRFIEIAGYPKSHTYCHLGEVILHQSGYEVKHLGPHPTDPDHDDFVELGNEKVPLDYGRQA